MFSGLFRVICCALALFFTSQAAFAAAGSGGYEEGVHYKVRGDRLTERMEIREFFSFWCGHCFAMQPVFKKIAKDNPDAAFVPNPVMMLGGPMGAETQRGYVIAMNAGLGELYLEELFNEMHVKHNIPATHKDLGEFMTKLGVPLTTFEREFNSFPVVGMVSQFDTMVDKAQINAVPELLINGKYLVVMESVDSEQELMDLVRHLLHKDKLPAAAR